MASRPRSHYGRLWIVFELKEKNCILDRGLNLDLQLYMTVTLELVSLMIITEFGNALPKFRHNKVQIVGHEARKDNYKRKVLSWIGICLE